MTLQAVLDKLIWGGLGALLSTGLAYVALGRDVAYIRGQISHIIDAIRDYYKFKERHALVERDLQKAEQDIASAHDKIRALKRIR